MSQVRADAVAPGDTICFDDRRFRVEDTYEWKQPGAGTRLVRIRAGEVGPNADHTPFVWDLYPHVRLTVDGVR